MIVNCRIEITDEWRQLLKSHIVGKTVKSMVSRKDVNEFVQGCIAAACEDYSYAYADQAGESPRPFTSNLSEAEEGEVERLRKEGHDDSYITGWLVVGRGSGGHRPRFPKTDEEELC